MQVQFLGQEDPLEEKMAWRIPWTEEPNGLQYTGWEKNRHDQVTEHTPGSDEYF